MASPVTSIPIEVGSLWQRKRNVGGHHELIVKVTRVTVNNVYYMEKTPPIFTKPLAHFLGTFEPVETSQRNGGLPLCKRCKDFRVEELGHKLCRYCVKDVAFRTVHSSTKSTEKNGPVIVVQPPLVASTEISDAAEEDLMPESVPIQEVNHWRVSVRRWIPQEETLEIAADEVIDVLDALEKKGLGRRLQITNIQLLDNGNGNGSH